METFVQPKITGYRQLSSEEAALINEVKAAGQTFEAAVKNVRAYLLAQSNLSSNVQADHARLADAEPARWAALGRTSAQQATMFLVRAVAQPAS